MLIIEIIDEQIAVSWNATSNNLLFKADLVTIRKELSLLLATRNEVSFSVSWSYLTKPMQPRLLLESLNVSLYGKISRSAKGIFRRNESRYMIGAP